MNVVSMIRVLFCYCIEGSDVPGVLLSRMAELLSGVPVEPYTETLAKFDWEKVRFASFSAEDCKRMWSTISRQVCYVVFVTLTVNGCGRRSAGRFVT